MRPLSPPRAPDLGAIVEQLADGIIVAGANLEIVFANAAAAKLIGVSIEQLVGSPVESIIPPRLRPAHIEGVRRYFRTGETRLVGGRPFVVAALRGESSEVDVELTLSAVGSPGEEGFLLIASLRDVSDDVRLERERLAAELEREALLARMQDAERTQSFLLQASRILGQAAGFAESLDALAALAVPVLGDICLIDIANERGGVTRMAARHADSSRQEEVDQLGRLYPPSASGPHPSVTVMRTGRSMWSEVMTDDFLRATTRDARHYALVKRLRFSSYLSVPLTSRRQVLGSLTIVSTDPERSICNRELVLAESLAGQAAEIVDKARRYEQEHEMAHVLQSRLLPAALDPVPGYEVAVRYLPSTLGAEVGGDWYDIVRLADGTFAFTVGDVSGHDLWAAAAMGQLRSVGRALASQAADPAGLITALRAGWERLEVERTATVAVAALTGRGRAVVVSAGHPPPILVDRGRAETVGLRPATPLGAPPSEAAEAVVPLRAGSTLLLYTDGLVEVRRRPLPEGIARLQQRLEGFDGSVEELCDRAIAGVSEVRSDDIALLALRRVEP